MKKKTMVVGASPNPDRYSYKAVQLLSRHEHPIVPLGIRKGGIDGHEIVLGQPEMSDIHTVTIYVGTAHQADYFEYIASLKPKRVIFNPGTENPDWSNKLEKQGVEVVENCTLVMLNSGLF